MTSFTKTDMLKLDQDSKREGELVLYLGVTSGDWHEEVDNSRHVKVKRAGPEVFFTVKEAMEYAESFCLCVSGLIRQDIYSEGKLRQSRFFKPRYSSNLDEGVSYEETCVTN